MLTTDALKNIHRLEPAGPRGMRSACGGCPVADPQTL